MNDTKDNWPAEAIAVIRRVLDENAEKYEPGNWRTITMEEHIKHAEKRLVKFDWINYGNPEDNLAHALTRLALAVAVREAKK